MKLSFVLSLAALLSAAVSFSQSVVYDNTTKYLHQGMPLLNPFRNDSAEMGDEVRLAGAEREVIELKLRFWYGGTSTGTFDARIRFRPLMLDKLVPGPAILQDGKIVAYRDTPTPGPSFYDSGLVLGLPVVPGMNEYTFRIPRVKVPDRFVWTIQAYNSKGTVGNVGPAYYDPPTVGSSEDFFWHSDMDSAWIAYSWGGDLMANFGARITALRASKPPGKRKATSGRGT